MIEFVVLIIIIIIFILYFKKKEHYNLGTIDQLMAKDAQDIYLTGNGDRYLSPWYINQNYSDIGLYYGNPYYYTLSY